MRSKKTARAMKQLLNAAATSKIKNKKNATYNPSPNGAPEPTANANMVYNHNP